MRTWQSRSCGTGHRHTAVPRRSAVALQLGKVEEGQTVEGCMTWILAQTKLGNLKSLVVLLLEEGRHGIVAEVALFHLCLVGLVVGSQCLVELVRHVVDTTCQSIDGNVGTLYAEIVQLGNATAPLGLILR